MQCSHKSARKQRRNFLSGWWLRSLCVDSSAKIRARFAMRQKERVVRAPIIRYTSSGEESRDSPSQLQTRESLIWLFTLQSITKIYKKCPTRLALGSEVQWVCGIILTKFWMTMLRGVVTVILYIAYSNPCIQDNTVMNALVMVTLWRKSLLYCSSFVRHCSKQMRPSSHLHIYPIL